MPKFLIQGSYSVEGVKGVQKEGGTGRRQAVEQVIEALGGKVEAFYFAFGDEDAVGIVELPDNAAAAAFALAVNAAGGVAVKTTVLLAPEEVDAASKQSVDYRPPGA